ncbi:MAG: acetyl-CoA carboxylase biotin carboxylase subunit [Oscillospiraceae bacterium]|jgi:acetyl-CoA carboxylase biotin carboxylase subunit|nr:acetyl-CoA carboxylase biotin carboxylase subunit [Oscillospiraceae bacterium]
MFSKILIANRGEIAIRVIRACKEMGIASVAVFSEADRESLHVSLADESYCIGGALSRESYLNMNSVLAAAMASKAEAIHPGYGFLSENAEFAKLCTDNDIVFIGPDSETIAKMGDKDMARKTMREAGVPVIPGCDLVRDFAHAKSEAEKIGFPLLIKARSGGGGRGIRHVSSMDELEHCYNTATAEAASAFGDGAVYIEKFLFPVKHIEMQLLADNFGNVVCLGERDCSTQRKNQKLIEESPAAIMPDEVRARMIDVSIKAGKAVGYRGAGTIEYLYDMDGNFYFMEMNTRLQVEHPVTEMVTLIDLVKWQIRVASGMVLGFSQDDIVFKGCAIECRINAEDPYRDFAPSVGKIEMLHVPNGPWVRFDSAIYQGYSISPFYDSMIGKLIVYAQSRDEAIRKMKAALCELIIEGVVHTASFQAELLSSEEFVNSTYTTDYLLKYI